ncbi:MAG: MFS transporter [Alphaproteobacteria bacterium]|nr:MFS transporter [Alphaproteobacteria bacterium]
MPTPAPPPPRALRLRLALFYAAMFVPIGVHLPFWPVWLAGRGLAPEQISLVLTVMQVVRLVTNPFIARMADRLGERKRPIMAAIIAGTIAVAAYWPMHGPAAILAVTVLHGTATGPILTLHDTLTLEAGRRWPLDYGRLRLWGSIAFIAAAAGSGFVLAGRSSEWVLALLFAGALACLAGGVALPDLRLPPRGTGGGTILPLLASPVFMLFSLLAGLVQGSHALLYGFGTLHWRAGGLSESLIGMLWAEGVVAEIILFYLGAAVSRRLGPFGLSAIAAAAATLRWLLATLPVSLPLLVVVQALHGLSFGAQHLASMLFLAKAVPPERAATAQALHATLGIGLVMGASTWASGRLYAALGARAFLVMAAMAAAALLLALALALVLRAKGEAAPASP